LTVGQVERSDPRRTGRCAADEKEEGVVTATLATSPLTAADRCDRCGAQAYVRVLLASGGELLFCAHHGREHAPALSDAAATIQDQSDRLRESRANAPDGER
jgi:hypothetical protein